MLFLSTKMPTFQTPSQLRLALLRDDRQADTWQSLREALNDGLESIDRRLREYGPLEPERFCLQEANQRLAQREDSLRWRRA
jgi:hypothetical protein